MTVYDRGVPLADMAAAGGYKRVNGGGVSDLFRTPAQYGPSLAAYNTWKKFGIPTSETVHTTTFGRSSMAGLEMERSGKAMPKLDPRHSSRNPISWAGVEEPPPRRVPEPPAYQPQLASATAHSGYMPAMPTQSPALKEEQMGQTWAELMRNGQVKPSAALAMMDMPDYSTEPQPPPAFFSSSVHTIGLQPQHTGRAHRSSNFTGQFRDPLDNM